MDLSIDAGNTNIKYALFEGNTLSKADILTAGNHSLELRNILRTYPITSAIISSVRETVEELTDVLRSHVKTMILSHELRFPFELSYDTPETLGHDRLANATGAMKFFPGKNILIVDCGTCMTYTLVDRGALTGGTISPGISMRFEALHHYTGKLPHITDARVPIELPGKNTRDSIISGVLNAIVAETDSLIQQYCSISDNLNVVLTGGNTPFFEKHLKSPIFAVPYLTHEGLHEILLFNS
jgi:type III pantothenate kinase